MFSCPHNVNAIGMFCCTLQDATLNLSRLLNVIIMSHFWSENCCINICLLITATSPVTFNLLKPNTSLRTNSFNIQKFCVLPKCIYVFCVDLRTNIDYFSIQQ